MKSNAIVLVKNGQTIGIGAGQMSRVESVEIALKKASDKVNGASSDAFFPFKDSIDHLAAQVSPLLFNRVVPSETRKALIRAMIMI